MSSCCEPPRPIVASDRYRDNRHYHTTSLPKFTLPGDAIRHIFRLGPFRPERSMPRSLGFDDPIQISGKPRIPKNRRGSPDPTTFTHSGDGREDRVMTPDPSSLCLLIDANRIPVHLYKAATSPKRHQVPIARVLCLLLASNSPALRPDRSRGRQPQKAGGPGRKARWFNAARLDPNLRLSPRRSQSLPIAGRDSEPLHSAAVLPRSIADGWSMRDGSPSSWRPQHSPNA